MSAQMTLSFMRPAKGAAGFGLVELMVAMTLSVILLGGVIAIFVSSRTTYETTDRLSRIQENGRFALDSIVRDIRASGYIGCSQRAPFTNTLNTPDTMLWNFQFPVQGFDAQGGSWKPALDLDLAKNAERNFDALVVRLPRHNVRPVRVTTEMDSTTSAVTTEDVGGDIIKVNDVVMLSDCGGRSVFEVTAAAAGVLSHDESAATDTSPGNDNTDLNYRFSNTGEVIPLQSVIYYLAKRDGAGADDPPSLYRRVSGTGATEELVEGVENMQLRFGERVGNDIEYHRADEVEDWGAVFTVSIGLLVRSLSAYGNDVDNATYDVLDEEVAAPGDRHLRQVFTTTATVRNEAL